LSNAPNPSSLALRLLLGFAAALWLYLFMPPIGALGLLHQPVTMLWLLVPLAVAQAFPWKIVRLMVGVGASFGYIFHYYRLALPYLASSKALVHREWTEISLLLRQHQLVDPLQTQLFLFFLCFLFWLVTYAVHRRRLWIFYNGIGLLVLGIMDGNTKVHPNVELVTMVFLAIAVLGATEFRRLATTPFQRRTLWARFTFPLALLLCLSSGVAFALPKPAASWPDPFDHLGTGSGPPRSGAGAHYVGYQLNDSHLGGPFIEDNTPVLSVIESRPTYIGGQTLSTYTGKGWVSAGLTGSSVQNVPIGKPFLATTDDAIHHLPTKPLKQTITILTNRVDTHILLGAYAVNQVDSLPDVLGNNLVYDDIQGNLIGPQLAKGSTYVLTSTQLVEPYRYLAQSSPALAGLRAQLPRMVVRYDLQLPTSLPQDVRQLAKKITAHAKTEYGAAVRIESYLKSHYTYHSQGVPVPSKNQDYVAQFLFQSKRGYCNNFSSSMAVLLRTIGVPTRWATGFAAGTENTNYAGPGQEYTITEADAHSWVEVYFPGDGWVPFDPTPTYSMPFAPGAASAKSAAAAKPTPPVAPDKTPPVTPVKHHVVQPPKNEGSAGDVGTSTGFTLAWWVWLGLAVAAATGGAILLYKRRLRPAARVREWERTPRRARGRKLSARPLLYLISRLQAVGWVPDGVVSLRDLVRPAERTRVSLSSVRKMVTILEAHWYGGREVTSADRNFLVNTWLVFLAGIGKPRRSRRERKESGLDR
jgi:transglutaminase-like putative cysteine protease